MTRVDTWVLAINAFFAGMDLVEQKWVFLAFNGSVVLGMLLWPSVKRALVSAR